MRWRLRQGGGLEGRGWLEEAEEEEAWPREEGTGIGDTEEEEEEEEGGAAGPAEGSQREGGPADAPGRGPVPAASDTGGARTGAECGVEADGAAEGGGVGPDPAGAARRARRRAGRLRKALAYEIRCAARALAATAHTASARRG